MVFCYRNLACNIYFSLYNLSFMMIIKNIYVLLIIFFIPKISEACAVCFSGNEENLLAFYFTTALLILLPIIMILSLIIWINRQSKNNL